MGWRNILTRQRPFIAFLLSLLLVFSPLSTPIGGMPGLLFEVSFGVVTPLSISAVVGWFW